MKLIKFFLGFIIICIFTVFATSNLQKVQLNFMGKSLIGYQSPDVVHPREGKNAEPPKKPREIPVFLLVYLTFTVGFLTAWFLSLGMVKKHRKTSKLLKKANRKQTEELESLRKLPVTDPEQGTMEDVPALPVSTDTP